MTLIISYAKVVNKNVYPPQTVVIYKRGGKLKSSPSITILSLRIKVIEKSTSYTSLKIK